MMKICDRFISGLSTVHMYSTEKIPKHGMEYVLDPFFFNSVGWIQLCDKENLTFVDYCDEILLNTS